MNIEKDIAKEQRTEGIEPLNFVEFFKLINKNFILALFGKGREIWSAAIRMCHLELELEQKLNFKILTKLWLHNLDKKFDSFDSWTIVGVWYQNQLKRPSGPDYDSDSDMPAFLPMAWLVAHLRLSSSCAGQKTKHVTWKFENMRQGLLLSTYNQSQNKAHQTKRVPLGFFQFFLLKTHLELFPDCKIALVKILPINSKESPSDY